MILNIKKNDEEYSNIISTRKLNEEARRTLKFESSAFAKTLGPYGMNTILEDRNLSHRVTKDGYTVYGSMVIYNKIGRVIARLIQKISGSLNETSGDGTTSSVVVANELYRLKKLINRHRIPPRLLSNVVSKLTIDIIKTIEDESFSLEAEIEDNRDILNDESLTPEQRKEKIRSTRYYQIIKNIAAISLNNDYEDGQMIADIFTELQDPANGAINVEVSTSAETRFDKDRGFEIFRGMITPEMVTEPDGRTAQYNNPRILLVKGSLMTDDIEAVGKVVNFVIGTLGQPLVIIAGGFSQAITETFRQSIITFAEKNKRIMPLLCIEVDTESSLGNNQFMDVEANVGAQAITVGHGKNFPIEAQSELYLKYLGSAKQVVCKSTAWTRIIDGKSNDNKVNFRISEINKQLAILKSEQHIDQYHEIFKLNKRKACLLNDMITLYIGGSTIEEKESRRDLFDDAVRGCKSAVRNGVTRGGNLIVAHVCNNYLNNSNKIKELVDQCITELSYNDMVSSTKMEKIIIDVLKELREAYIRSYAIVVNNKFNNKHLSHTIAKKCVKNNSVYNLISGKYESWVNQDNDISNKNLVINSSETDTQILRAATSILDLLITSNQFIRTPQMAQMQKNL